MCLAKMALIYREELNGFSYSVISRAPIRSARLINQLIVSRASLPGEKWRAASSALGRNSRQRRWKSTRSRGGPSDCFGFGFVGSSAPEFMPFKIGKHPASRA